MDERTTVALLATIDDGWNALRTPVAALSSAQLERPLGTGWTLKEMLAHVAFWEEAMLSYLPPLRGQPAPALADWYGGEGLSLDEAWPHFDVHNAREAAWARSRPAAVVLERLDTAHRRIRALAADLTDEDLARRDIWEAITGNTVDHYRDHLADVTSVVR